MNLYLQIAKFYCVIFTENKLGKHWIKERKHGLYNEDRLLLLGLLRNCATAPPDFTTHEVDHKHCDAVKALKDTQTINK